MAPRSSRALTTSFGSTDIYVNLSRDSNIYVVQYGTRVSAPPGSRDLTLSATFCDSYFHVSIYRCSDVIVVRGGVGTRPVRETRECLLSKSRSDVAPVLNPAVSDGPMLLTSIYKSVLTRILAAAIIVLIVSPYSEPFATMAGTDFGGAGAVDCGGGSKFKSPTQDAVAPAPLRLVLVEMCLPSESPMVTPMALATRSHQRLVLRL